MRTNANTNTNTLEVTSMAVSRVRAAGKVVFFTLTLNGIDINNCRVVEGRNGDFIAFPEYKGTDGNYYKVVYARLDDKTQDAIIKEVAKHL